MPEKPHILIIGGGIAGPALALFLKKAGLTSTIYEAYPKLADIGGGLGLAPNGMHVLDELGLADRVIAAGSVCDTMAFRDQRGKLIGTIPYGMPGRPGRPAVTLTRASLHAIIVEALEREGIAIEYGKKLRAIESDGEGVTARFEDGSSARGGLLVGADGIRSRVREIILPEAPEPAFTGLVGVGGFVPRTALPLEKPGDDTTMSLWFGPGSFFGCAFGDRTAENGAFWWTALERERPLAEAERAGITLETVRDTLLKARGGWPEAVTRILGTPTRVMAFNLFDVASLPRWWSGRAVLIGDAAHAVSPHSGQGVSMALEDTITLAKCLRDQPETPLKAFAAFEEARRERAEKVVAYGRRNGDGKKKQGPVATWLWQLAMPFFLRFAGRSQAWILGHRIRWEG